MLHLNVHYIYLLPWHKFLKFHIHDCVVYARLQKMIDEMKTSMHRMIVRLPCMFYKWYQSLAYNVDLMRYLVIVFCKCYLTNHGVKDGVQMATPIGITLQRSILYTLASFGRHYFPTLFLSMHMCKLSNPNSQHIYRGS